MVAPKSITLTITGTDGRTTEVEIIDSQSDGPCISNYQVNGFATIDIIEEIGLGEWGYRFVIETNDGRWFEAEFGPGSTLERTYDSPRVLTFGPIDPPPDS